ncbi:MAG: aminodeoxychorismate synthase component I [Helicobacter sp.]|nr:aminodeoxychorismate synthase component I [Helicobacter sp.]MDY5741259.1 aminodeoxychorismate synthase component I [Helicobacter sp.]
MWIFGKYAYYKPTSRIVAYQKNGLQEAFSKIQSSAKNSYVLGFVSYEAGIFSQDFSQLQVSSKLYDTTTQPLLEFWCFKKRKKLQKILHKNTNPTLAFSIHKNLDQARYKKYFRRIKKELACGNTYQVNYTQELKLSSHNSAFGIFTSLLPKQDTSYKAFISTDSQEIICFSPELFFKLKNDKITLQPMKGTIARGKTKKEDEHRKKLLRTDSKNKAENIMIVDLLRNDISQIARSGTLKIKNLFKIKTLPSLHQMVSTLQARLKKDSPGKTCNLFAIFDALFPCGSITGAPKKSTMHIIKALENQTRDVYCGSIGLVYKKKAIFNVAIRTLQRRKGEPWRYGVGGAIVWDSKCSEEFAELQLKSQFLFSQDFKLFETMLLRRTAKGLEAFLGEYHFYRILRSACELYGLDANSRQNPVLYELLNSQKPAPSDKLIVQTQNLVQALLRDSIPLHPLALTEAWMPLPINFTNAVESALKDLDFTKTHKPFILKFLLDKNGTLEFEAREKKDFPHNSLPVQVSLSKHTQDWHNDFLYHKTTNRAHFVVPDSCEFDVIYQNQRGEFTEGTRCNIAILQDSQLLTPALSSGLLCGCMRELLLSCGCMTEKILKTTDSQNARIFALNSVYGVFEVRL